MTDVLNFPLWSDDHTYTLSITLNRNLPNPTPVTNQVAWNTSLENRVRLQIGRLCCEDVSFVEGVKVERSMCNSRQSYHVNNDISAKSKDYLMRYSLEDAVMRVVQLVAEREKWKIHTSS